MNLRSIRSRFLLCKREKHEGEQKKTTRDGGTAGEKNDSGGGGVLGLMFAGYVRWPLRAPTPL